MNIDRSAKLDEILASYFCRVDADEQVDEAALIELHPDLAAELRNHFAGQKQLHARLQDLGVKAHSTDDAHRLSVQCPHCHQTNSIAVDSTLTDLVCSSCGSQFQLIDPTAETIDFSQNLRVGRFRLLERLGAGAFGVVWKAQDESLDRLVAIKIPLQRNIPAELQEKFFREARAAAQLRHPSIVSVHEVGRDGETIFIVSDYIEGVSLADWLTGQQLTSREAAQMAAQLAGALHAAHERGVVHRDLKPANVLIDRDGVPHITDFGLARRDIGEVTVTMDGQILGTPAYMAPEQAAGRAHEADRRSDVYSLGVMLFQMLTGELPFRGNPRMLLHQVINDPAPSPRKFNSNVSRDLETIVLKCLEKAPVQRLATALELAEELRRFLQSEAIRSRPVGPIGKFSRWANRNRLLASVSAVAASLAVVAFVTLVASNARVRREAAITAAALDERERALARELDAKRSASTSLKESQAINRFLLNDVFGVDVQDFHAGAPTTVVEMISLAENRLDESFDDQPLVKARLHSAIGKLYGSQLKWSGALDNHRRALTTYEAELGESSDEVFACLADIAIALQYRGKPTAASKVWESLFARVLRRGVEPPALDRWKTKYYEVLIGTGRGSQALAEIESQLESRDHTPARSDFSLHALAANAALDLGDLEAAKRYVSELRDLIGSDGTPYEISELAVIELNLAQREGDSKAALDAAITAYVVGKQHWGRAHANSLIMGKNLAAMYEQLGRESDRLRVLHEVLDDQSGGPPYLFACDMAEYLAGYYLDRGDVRKSLGLFARADDLARRMDDAKEQRDCRVRPLSYLAFLPLVRPEPSEADRDLAAESLRNLRKLAPESPMSLLSEGLLALRNGLPAEAIAPLERSFDLRFGGRLIQDGPPGPHQHGVVRRGAAGFQWLRVRLERATIDGNPAIRWMMNGRLIGEVVLEGEQSDQYASFGYFDCFPSVSSSPEHSFAMIDNLRVYGDRVYDYSFDDPSWNGIHILKSSDDVSVEAGVDYGKLNLPAAPNSPDSIRRGVRLAANVSEPASKEAVRLVLQMEHVQAVEFDAWLNFVGPGPNGGAGATESLFVGLLGDKSTHCSPDFSGSGVWCSWNGVGDDARGDYRFFRDAEELSQHSKFVKFACGRFLSAHNPYYGGHGPRATDLLLIAVAHSRAGSPEIASKYLAEAVELLKHEKEVLPPTNLFLNEARLAIESSDGQVLEDQ